MDTVVLDDVDTAELVAELEGSEEGAEGVSELLCPSPSDDGLDTIDVVCDDVSLAVVVQPIKFKRIASNKQQHISCFNPFICDSPHNKKCAAEAAHKNAELRCCTTNHAYTSTRKRACVFYKIKTHACIGSYLICGARIYYHKILKVTIYRIVKTQKTGIKTVLII